MAATGGGRGEAAAQDEASFRSESVATLAAPKSTPRQQQLYRRRLLLQQEKKARSQQAQTQQGRRRRLFQFQHDGSVSKNRDLPDQLEAHAHRLLMDAGWRIRPRIRNDRARMAYYFAAPAPQEAVVVTSLSQAWRLCGQSLRSTATSGGLGSQQHQFPPAADWSDVDRFWKDLVDAMDSVEGDNMATLLLRR